ncbi:MAG: CinA family protein [Lachnospiraceae bacterium]|nr:CinA family protein [Lachnospiraceae bacterium]MBQ4068570.1 CinA family protein [Lachnospiraceae bacterium]
MAIEDNVVKLLMDNNLTITTIESCTGGKIASKLTNVSGVSQVYEKGFITYSNDAKCELVGVDKKIIEKFGVVSEQTAREMAIKGAKTAHTSVALSVTGIAGPLGGTKELPVGTVFIGCYLEGNTLVEKCQFNGDRESIRENAAKKALNILQELIVKKYKIY